MIIFGLVLLLCMKFSYCDGFLIYFLQQNMFVLTILRSVGKINDYA